MFYSCSALQSVTFPEGFGQAAYDMSDMFRECSSLTLDCSGWNVDNVTIYYGFDTDADGVTPPAWVN